MKKIVIIGSVVIMFGMFIALGPQFLFKVCSPVVMVTEVLTADCGDDGSSSCCCSGTALSYPICHWTAQAEIGIGFLIAALGICLLVFSDLKTQQGLTIGVFLSSIIAISIPHILIGGCDTMIMACRKITFPILSLICIIILIGSVIYLIHIESKIKK
ncbi:MAG: DUF4418 family protein [Treponema sp.]|nr:DUF4418 family protein [Treponema sp.]